MNTDQRCCSHFSLRTRVDLRLTSPTLRQLSPILRDSFFGIFFSYLIYGQHSGPLTIGIGAANTCECVPALRNTFCSHLHTKLVSVQYFYRWETRIWVENQYVHCPHHKGSFCGVCYDCRSNSISMSDRGSLYNTIQLYVDKLSADRVTSKPNSTQQQTKPIPFKGNLAHSSCLCSSSVSVCSIPKRTLYFSKYLYFHHKGNIELQSN